MRKKPKRNGARAKLPVPVSTIHRAASDVPISRSEAWEQVDWELVARAMDRGEAASFPCADEELDAALRRFWEYLLWEAETQPPIAWCHRDGRLWFWRSGAMLCPADGDLASAVELVTH